MADVTYRPHWVGYGGFRVGGGRMVGGGPTGLVAPWVGGLLVMTGIHTGTVLVATVAADDPPPVSLEGWEDVEEASLAVDGADSLAVVLEGTVGHVAPASLTAGQPGSYRLRVHAVGRDADPDGVATVPVERYLLVCWAAPLGPPGTLAASTGVHAAKVRGAVKREWLSSQQVDRAPTAGDQLRAAQLASLEAAALRRRDRDRR